MPFPIDENRGYRRRKKKFPQWIYTEDAYGIFNFAQNIFSFCGTKGSFPVCPPLARVVPWRGNRYNELYYNTENKRPRDIYKRRLFIYHSESIDSPVSVIDILPSPARNTETLKPKKFKPAPNNPFKWKIQLFLERRCKCQSDSERLTNNIYIYTYITGLNK